MATFEIAVPADLSNAKICKRFQDFKKYGFYNIGDHTLNVYLLGSKGVEAGNILEGWPKNVNAFYHQTPYTQVAQRIYFYYAKMMLPNRADWYLRIDEDSMNDIEGLADILQTDFDPRREYHLVGHLNMDTYNLDRTLLTMLGYGRFYQPHDNHNYNISPPHEVEIGLSSNAAMQKLYSCADSMKYFAMRKEFPEGWGDHGLTHAMRIAKIYPVVCPFMTHQAELINFSIFGGQRYHVHWISRDRNPKMLIWLDMFTKEQFTDVTNSTFFLGKRDSQKKVIKFMDTHSIRTIQHMNNNSSGEPIGLWCKIGEKLAVYTEDKGEEIAIFERQDEGKWVWNELELIKLSS